MKKIMLLIAILVVYGCKKKIEEPESSKTSSISGYQFKGLINMGYDNTGKCHWVSYSEPNDYSWGTDILNFSSNTFTGFGGGTYTKSNDTTYINELNWHAVTSNGFNCTLGYTIIPSNCKILYCDTTLNVNSFSSTGELFIVYAKGLSNTPGDLAPNQIRLFLFE